MLVNNDVVCNPDILGKPHSNGRALHNSSRHSQPWSILSELEVDMLKRCPSGAVLMRNAFFQALCYWTNLTSLRQSQTLSSHWSCMIPELSKPCWSTYNALRIPSNLLLLDAPHISEAVTARVAILKVFLRRLSSASLSAHACTIAPADQSVQRASAKAQATEDPTQMHL